MATIIARRTVRRSAFNPYPACIASTPRASLSVLSPHPFTTVRASTRRSIIAASAPASAGELPLQGSSLQLLRLCRRRGIRQSRRESYRGQKNPEVTVRARGVMEKCTYCVQRISGARRASERENRPLGPHEVQTACQNACPTRAISFGDLNQADAEINHRKADPRHYALLGHLGTRPRTTYLADVRNPAPSEPEGRT